MVDRFIVVNEKGLKALPRVLRKHRKHVNVYSTGGQNGVITYSLGWDDKPDSDWGKYRGARLRVIVPKEELWDPVEDMIRESLGWEPIERSPSQDAAQERE